MGEPTMLDAAPAIDSESGPFRSSSHVLGKEAMSKKALERVALARTGCKGFGVALGAQAIGSIFDRSSVR